MTYPVGKNFFRKDFVCDDRILEIATPRLLEEILASNEKSIGVSEFDEGMLVLYVMSDNITPRNNQPLSFKNLVENLNTVPAAASLPRYRLAEVIGLENTATDTLPTHRRFIRMSDDLSIFAAEVEAGVGIPQAIRVELAFDAAGKEFSYREISLERPNEVVEKKFLARASKNNG